MAISNSIYWWRVITHLGSASILLPIFFLHFLGLFLVQRKVAYRWLFALGLAVLLTLMSKCLFWGWGLGIAALDFTGISGHTLLATAIFPVLFRLYISSDSRFKCQLAACLGILFSVGVGWSRIILGAHSFSEVCLGWALGAAVSLFVLNAIEKPLSLNWAVRLSPLLFFLAFNSYASQIVPSHAWEVKLALALSGRDHPFRR
ncbi:hypothetical protein HC248_02118 [Polaromonas vacuolata]|uniref:Phosphatidic acid phosphatase type 2/haloperoxidase domain-containing protein n=1 Tax=Polaromonas vacuolata TaxID=37448 RepID=A0A6H2HAL3_9BURK|nr:phosphatase PAP2 family protein [Polaromonas vacuolata]QJC56807.1 hypothetical protein HC248_02118 [Polaromonas vacuolata]